MWSFLFGMPEEATIGELRGMARRSRFSRYLPYEAYDEKTRLYYLADGTRGYLWECAPLIFASDATADTLQGLFRAGFPEDTILQFILHADDHIEPLLSDFISLKTRQDSVVQSQARTFADFYRRGTRGMQNCAGIPVRNFRLFVSLKFPKSKDKLSGSNLQELRTTTEELLVGAALHPAHCEPPRLLDWLRRIFNDEPSLNNGHYDDTRPLKHQIILGTDIKREAASLRIGNKHLRCLTPKVFPKQLDFFATNQLAGGLWGLASDRDQITTPFLYTFNIIFSNLNMKLRSKCEFILFQQAAGSLARSLADKKDEYNWAVHEIDNGQRFVQMMPVLWVWGDSEASALESVTRTKRIWESGGYVMQDDRKISTPLFVASLPFGLYDDRSTLALLERDFIVNPAAAIRPLPIQGDFAGGGRPVLLYFGRKGQIVTLDMFNRELGDNYNFFIAGGSGGGKSFNVNYIVSNYRSVDTIVNLIDIGGSYKKSAAINGGKFLDFTLDSDICINPFTNIGRVLEKADTETDAVKRMEIKDVGDSLSAITAVVLQMAYSATDAPPVDHAETIWTLAGDAVSWAYESEGSWAGTDAIYSYLQEFPNHSGDLADRLGHSADQITTTARMLAFNLSKFTNRGKGLYGRWFNGPSTLDISRDDFVVLELEHLKSQPPLFKVATLQIINETVQNLYLSDRTRNRLVLLDEAWQFMDSQSIALARIIESGYRRARKYGGGLGVIIQSVGDLKNFGPVGEVIRTNSAYKFLLPANNFEEMKAQKIIDYDDFTMRLLKSVRKNGSKYGEIFMDTPAGRGVVRLVVDDYTYYVNTSDPKEFSEIESLVKRGMNYDEAIRHMVAKYRS